MTHGRHTTPFHPDFQRFLDRHQIAHGFPAPTGFVEPAPDEFDFADGWTHPERWGNGSEEVLQQAQAGPWLFSG